MGKLEKMLVEVKKSTSTTSTSYYGYIDSRRCSEHCTEFVRGTVYPLPSPIPGIEIAYISRERLMEWSVWMDETEDSLRQCVHEHSSATSWTCAGSYIAIFKGDRLFFASIGGMHKWTVDDIAFEEDKAIISGSYQAPNMMGGGFSGLGFRPGDMGYYKEEYSLEVPQVDKLPF